MRYEKFIVSVEYFHHFSILSLFPFYKDFIRSTVHVIVIAVNHLIIGIIQAVVEHLENVLRAGGYWVIGIVAIAEALPLFGTIIPGHTVVILGGFFSRLGFLNIYVVMVIAALGAIIGDVFAYFLGKKYGLNIFVKWGRYFLIKEEQIKKAEAVLNRHSGKAIILGRWSPITRAFVPFIAGASGVRAKSFWIYDIIAGVIWAVVSVYIGYIFGSSYMLIAHAIGRFTTMGIVILLLIIFAYYFINSRRHIFGKYDFHILVVCLVSLYLFFQSINDVIASRPFMAALDIEVNLIMAHHIVPFLVSFAEMVSDILSPTTIGIAAVVMTIWFVYKKYWHNFYITLVAYPFSLIFTLLLKTVVERARPVNMLVHLTDYAFPSGHAVAAGIFFTLIIYFFTHYIKGQTAREFFVLVNVILIILVCLSRIYLNVHWLSDVIAGVTFGVFWATFSILTVHYVEGLTRGRGAKKLN